MNLAGEHGVGTAMVLLRTFRSRWNSMQTIASGATATQVHLAPTMLSA